MAQNAFKFDPITYNNNVLTHNIAILSQIPISQFGQLQTDNEKLRKELEDLKKENTNIKNENNLFKRKLEEILKNDFQSNKRRASNLGTKYKTIYFRRNEDSWSDKQVKEKLASIKTIDDIISLESHWFAIRHNLTLQRLHYLVSPLKKLQKMVGLEQVKRDIFKKIIYWIQNPPGINGTEEYLNTVITGPPGVGKTEFAKIYAEIFVKLGILQTEKFVEIKRDDLIGEYLGQTSPKTRELLDEAIGGVLFLDEAYSLGNEELRDSYSKEAIDMINQYLSEYKGKFMFIIAGYQEDIEKCFFAYNKGLKRRFHTYFNIEGYTPKELGNILKIKVNDSKQSFLSINYSLEISEDELNKFFTEKKDLFQFYGGDIEKLFNEIKHIQALRTFTSGLNDKKIIIEDLYEASKLWETRKEENYHLPLYI